MPEPHRLFGTDGIRGQVPRWPLTADFVVRLGQTLAEVVLEMGASPFVAVGRDTRSSGPMLEAALSSGLMERGLDVLPLGVIPTPAVAFLTRHFGAGLGVVISASHNPYPDNGIKLFSSTGFKVPEEVEREIERRIRDIQPLAWSGRPVIGQIVQPNISPGEAYLETLVGRAGRPQPLKGWTLVLDCAYGSTCEIAPKLFRRLGATVSVLHADPDGENINHNCGSEHPQVLQAALLRQKANAGVAFDGDGDRAFLVDDQGNVLDGDHLLTILARDLSERGQLRNRTVVATVASNIGLERALNAMGEKLERVGVGDRSVARRMLEGDFVLGGEITGHTILFGEGSTTGDGLYTAMKVLGIAVRRKVPLSTLTAWLQKYPQAFVNVPVAHKPPLESIPEIQRTRTAVEQGLGQEGRVLLRYSGTQPLLRVMVEGPNEAQVQQAVEALAGAVRRAIPGPQPEPGPESG